MDFSKEFEINIWPLIRNNLPRGKKTNTLDEIKKRIREEKAKDNVTIKNITWEVIKKYFDSDIISKKSKKTTDQKMDKLFQVKDK